jgi:sporulation protein YlmC with PRC-barrel domain
MHTTDWPLVPATGIIFLMSDSTERKTDFDYKALEQKLQEATSDEELFQTIVNAPFINPLPTVLIFLGIVVFLQVNPETGTIDRLALSKTEQARATTDVSAKPFNEIKIPVDYLENIIADAIHSGQPQDTTDWKFLFNPSLTAQDARINQANAGIAHSIVYPLKSRDGGALIFSYYQYRSEMDDGKAEAFMKRYSELVDTALSR